MKLKLSRESVLMIIRIINEIDAPWWPHGPSDELLNRLDEQRFSKNKEGEMIPAGHKNKD